MERKISVSSKVLEGLEAVRRSGKTNMLDVPVVVKLAIEMEFYETAVWVNDYREDYVTGVFAGFSSEEGGEDLCVD